ncbi:zinc finger c-x8-c-x5-c-x3-h type domain containing protein [Entamoeba nuttalli P19]|uniref:Zinc finger c-x8-c-x5-c-x3-h type domain containing protein n=1 Tax=Entamoeba nuttalli (strain P19) TaxID=1076696 RepID=K2GVX8_ENTNP|nr:zinc finger c-x8-c-x5-c-x3-h type domain containing protein [Entamoeba nuttalli P19]EKE39293.1 zinc finger c-x8-c-x5-c-x3-h type domain containing protein [Entamoeba nuttalli P19]|eukprot:XP_008858370.1 zinc finger c-x8-c-x5-c-x3-h type domain containing protein [Entamoeba nuttalli P19]
MTETTKKEETTIINGTKEKPVCEFFYKIGACRHGDACNKTHIKPESSQTLLFTRMYQNPKKRIDDGEALERDEKKIMREFNEFYEDVFRELENYGEILDFIVCGNDNDHMMGNVYVKYDTEEHAAAAKKALTGRYYAKKILTPNFCRVTEFKEAICRQQQIGTCTRGGMCNFIHVIEPDRNLKYDLFRKQKFRRRRERAIREEKEQPPELINNTDDHRRCRERYSRSRSRSDSKERHYRRDSYNRYYSSRSRSASRDRHYRRHPTSHEHSSSRRRYYDN